MTVVSSGTGRKSSRPALKDAQCARRPCDWIARPRWSRLPRLPSGRQLTDTDRAERLAATLRKDGGGTVFDKAAISFHLALGYRATASSILPACSIAARARAAPGGAPWERFARALEEIAQHRGTGRPARDGLARMTNKVR